MTQSSLPLGVTQAPWYYAAHGQVLGPFTWDRLRNLAATGQLAPSDLVCQEGQPQWVRAATVSGLYPSAPSLHHVTATPPQAVTDTPGLLASRGTPPVIPGYEILGELGRGGMGVVYKARQVNLNRTVALKVLLGAEQAGSAPRERFQREARALARAQFPGIVQIYDVGDHQGQAYLALQFIDGPSLKDHLRGAPLPPLEAAALVERLARVIHAAHQAGIVHRDLKPGNILIDREGKPHITDFGLAKDLAVDSQQTTLSGSVMGTPAYMAPEQAMGDGRAISPRTDIYALGAVLYELLTGAPPFVGPAHVILYNLIERQPEPPRRVDPRLPAELDRVCMQCLAKHPDQRPASALELADQLRGFADSRTTLAPQGSVERSRLTAAGTKRRWVQVGIAAGVLVLVGLLWSSERSRRLSEQTRDKLANEIERIEGLLQREQDAARTAERRRALSQYRQVLSDAHQDWSDSRHERARQRLALAPVECRHWEYGQLNALTAPPQLLALSGHDGGARAVALNPDGTLLASAGSDKIIRLWELPGGKEHKVLTGHTEAVTRLAFSSDGQTLVSSSRDKSVRVWDVVAGTLRTIYQGHSYEVLGVALSPDGQQAVSCDNYGYVQLWDTTKGLTQATLEGVTYTPSHSVAWSPDGKRIAWGSGPHSVKVWDVERARLQHTLSKHTTTVYALAFSPDSQRLVSGSGDSHARIWNLSTGQEAMALKAASTTIHSVAWSADGRLVFTGGSDLVVRQWDTESGKEHVWCRRQGTGTITGLVVHPDGVRLAASCGDRSVVLWDMRGRAARNWVYDHGDAINAVTFSNDGQRLATVGRDRSVRVWQTATGAEMLQIKTTDAPLCAAFSSDGQTLAAGLADRSVRVWDVAGERALHTLRKQKGDVLALAYKADGRQLYSASRDGTLQLWDLTDGKPGLGFEAHKGGVSALAMRGDGRQLASGGADRVVRLWDPDNGNAVHALNGHLEPVLALTYSADGKLLASQDAEGVVKLWNVETGKELWSLRPLSPQDIGNQGLAFSPDGQRLLVAAANHVRLIEVAGGEQVLALRLDSPPIQGLAFSADGRHVAVAGGSAVVLLYGGTP